MREVYGPAIRRERKRRGWTLPQLADRLEEIGAQDLADRSKLSKIEAQARSISIEEWITMALALEVSPAVLVSPYSIDPGQPPGPSPLESIRVGDLPPILPHYLRGWLEGQMPPLFFLEEFQGEPVPGSAEGWLAARSRDRFQFERWDYLLELNAELEAIELELGTGDVEDGELDQLEAQRAALIVQIRDLETLMRRDKILPFELLDEDQLAVADALADETTTAGRQTRLAAASRHLQRAAWTHIDAQQRADATHGELLDAIRRRNQATGDEA